MDDQLGTYLRWPVDSLYSNGKSDLNDDLFESLQQSLDEGVICRAGIFLEDTLCFALRRLFDSLANDLVENP